MSGAARSRVRLVPFVSGSHADSVLLPEANWSRPIGCAAGAGASSPCCRDWRRPVIAGMARGHLRGTGYWSACAGRKRRFGSASPQAAARTAPARTSSPTPSHLRRAGTNQAERSGSDLCRDAGFHINAAQSAYPLDLSPGLLESLSRRTLPMLGPDHWARTMAG
jgi:hypothetical protein